MALTDEQIAALRDLGRLGGKILKLRESVQEVVDLITQKQTERSNLQAQLTTARQEFQELWEELRQ